MKTSLRYLLGCAAASLLAISLNAQIITFTSDTTGNKPNGFSSVENSFVTFTDTLGADLQVGAYFESIGNGLAAFYDDSGAILMNFAGPADSLSLAFGNDDPGFTTPGDLATLSLYLGASLVGTQTVVMNRNDIADQTISFSGPLFDSAIFQYTDSGGAAINLIEVIDNIDVHPAAIVAVPEPSTYGLMGAAGLLAAVIYRRKRKA